MIKRDEGVKAGGYLIECGVLSFGPLARRPAGPIVLVNCVRRNVSISDSLLPFACHRGRIIGDATMILKFFAGLRHQTWGRMDGLCF